MMRSTILLVASATAVLAAPQRPGGGDSWGSWGSSQGDHSGGNSGNGGSGWGSWGGNGGDGHSNGYSAGYNDGYDDGNECGQDDGYNDDHDESLAARTTPSDQEQLKRDSGIDGQVSRLRPSHSRQETITTVQTRSRTAKAREIPRGTGLQHQVKRC